MVLLVAICSQTIFLVVVFMSGNHLSGGNSVGGRRILPLSVLDALFLVHTAVLSSCGHFIVAPHDDGSDCRMLNTTAT
jgi:hypothetical protein